MEISLDEESLKILKQAFQWSDFDQDGFISLDDLKFSGGIERDEDAQNIFQALKSPTNTSNFITFEEFSSRVMDFPLLLTQIKHDICESNSLNSPTQTQFSFDFLQDVDKTFNLADLSNIIQIFQIAIHGQPLSQQREYPSAKEKLKALTTVTKLLQQRCAQHKVPASSLEIIAQGTHILAQKLSDSILGEDTEKIQLQSKLQHTILSCESLTDQIKRLEQINQKIMVQLNELEQSNLKVQSEHSAVLAQKKQLQRRLDVAKSLEIQAKHQKANIQRFINEKQEAIVKLQKELRNLKSLKTIQEMKGNVNENAKQERKDRLAVRSTLPINSASPLIISPMQSPKTSQNQAYQFQALTNQAKNEKIRLLEAQVSNLNSTIEKSQANYKALKKKNLQLTLKLKQERSLALQRQESERQAITQHSTLFDEIKALDDHYTESVHYEAIKRPIADKSVQCMMVESAKKKRSECWSCI